MFFVCLLAVGIFNSEASFAHKNHPHHVEEKAPQLVPDEERKLAELLKMINESYKRDVKPIFTRSCFDCHSQKPNLPWYNFLPIARSLIENDMKEAKEHLDFTQDFPFKGHGAPKEDLEAIADAVRDRSMPPLRYRLMHWGAGLTSQERDAILKWATEGQKSIEQLR